MAQAAAVRRKEPAVAWLQVAVHPATRMRQAYFNSERQLHNVKEALFEPASNPIERIRQALDFNDKAREALLDLLTIEAESE